MRLVSGRGLVVFLSNPLKALPLRLATKRDLKCFFEGMHEVYHGNARKLHAEWPGTVVFLPDPVAFRPGQWQEASNQTIPVGLDGSHGLSLE